MSLPKRRSFLWRARLRPGRERGQHTSPPKCCRIRVDSLVVCGPDGAGPSSPTQDFSRHYCNSRFTYLNAIHACPLGHPDLLHLPLFPLCLPPPPGGGYIPLQPVMKWYERQYRSLRASLQRTYHSAPQFQWDARISINALLLGEQNVL
jgi:hypothetical protein